MIYYQDCHMAIEEAISQENMVVGYVNPLGWTIYNPIDGAPVIKGHDVVPEILCLQKPIMPIPLNDEAMEIVMSWIKKITLEAQLYDVNH